VIILIRIDVSSCGDNDGNDGIGDDDSGVGDDVGDDGDRRLG